MSRKTICIIGLGYIGLPTAAMFATHGHKITGVDINKNLVNELNQGRVVINEPYLDIMVQAAVTSGNLKAVDKPCEADVFIICVPTPITEDKKADMSYVRQATETIVPYLRKGNIVILESTSPAGTTKELVCPILEKSGLKTGDELFVAHSPERVLPGQILMELVNNNRIVGGINKESAELVRDLYRTFVKGEIYLTDATTAEMCKLMENTYRDVNIALANELAKLCENMGISAWEVIKLCNKHPRVNIHEPGPGVGGHCLAVDPWFIIENDPQTAQIIRQARDVNDNMPQHVMSRIEEILGGIEGKKKITVLGITYKPNIDDIRESPVIRLVELLEEKGGYDISIVDPYVKEFRYKQENITKAAEASDLIVLGVCHREFKDMRIGEIGETMRHKNFLSTKDFLKREVFCENGFNYFLLGDKNMSAKTL